MEEKDAETEAIQRLKRGDIGGMETLVRIHQAEALDVAYGITRDRSRSEDIVQSAFLRIFESIEKFDSSRSFGPWFLRAVVNDSLKAVTRRQTVSMDDEVLKELDRLNASGRSINELCEMVEAAQTKEAIWEAMDRLSPVHRAVIYMRYYLDLSDTEISQTLQVPDGTVRRRLHDGRKRLRFLLPSWVRR